MLMSDITYVAILLKLLYVSSNDLSQWCFVMVFVLRYFNFYCEINYTNHEPR